MSWQDAPLLLPLFLLLLLLPLARPSPACPPGCVCASDIISCSGCNLSAVTFDLPAYAKRLDLGHNALVLLPTDWLARLLPRLATLVLSHNAIAQIEPDAFTLTPRLHHLDLSSNRLAALNASTFSGLGELRVLVLFGNRIARINAGAFGALGGLERLYLSGNRLGAFPLALYRGPRGPRNLTFLDLSSNGIFQVPVQSLLALDPRRQAEIYLHGNPLACNCALVALLEYWALREYRPVLDFRAEYPCGGGGEGGAERLDCPGSRRRGAVVVGGDDAVIGGTYQIEPGDWLQVPCPGLAPPAQDEAVVFWVTPGGVLRTAPGGDTGGGRARVLPNGTLELWGARPEDAGTYSCVAARGRRPDPFDAPDVTVRVGNWSAGGAEGVGGAGGEHFNTAFTTLASCVVSIVLVLLYLYLTPCRCRGSGGARRWGGRGLLLCCSDPRGAAGEGRLADGKRVAFLEPGAGDQEGGAGPCGPRTAAVGAAEGILKNGSRTVGQTRTDRPAH